MSTTQSAIVTLAQTLCYSVGDATEMTRILTELLIELGQEPRLWFTNFTVFNGGTIVDPTDTTRLELPTASNIVHMLALFFDGRQLSHESIQHLDAANPLWRDVIGSPLAYVTENQNDRQFRITPQPYAQKSGSDTTTVEGGPAVIFTHTPTSGIPDVYALPLAWLVLGREFERESPHRDLNFAGIATALGKHYLEYIA